ncbi:MAG: dTDP-4-dehydrorhamnose 3,5-epimerase [bacterium]|nr:dTDP-4-dehydrorhamnose 3,5-epimerase [bacterium]
MIFRELEIPGAYLLEPERHEDRRGFFARTYCRHELEARGLDPTVVQCNISVNHQRGTVRGMHYQAPPYEEIKLVRCTSGAIWDVVVDLRPDSTTFKRHLGVELTAENRLSLYIPAGLAHGFQTLEDATEVFYQMSEFYHPECARGMRWNDPAFDIEWPIPISVISERDLKFPDFSEPAG